MQPSDRPLGAAVNMLLLAPGELRSDGTVAVTGRRARHLRTIQQVTVGTTLTVGEIGGMRGAGRVIGVEPQAVVLEVALTDPPPPAACVDLILAMPRPRMLRRLLRAIGSLGVGRCWIIRSWRVDKSYLESDLLQPAELRRQLLLGLEQARDTQLPGITVHPLFKPFVEDILPGALTPEQARLVLHPTSQSRLQAGLAPEAGRAIVAIGPEGGWLPYEVGRFEELGFVPCSLGPRVLTVETAVVVALAQVQVLLDR